MKSNVDQWNSGGGDGGIAAYDIYGDLYQHNDGLSDSQIHAGRIHGQSVQKNVG